MVSPRVDTSLTFPCSTCVRKTVYGTLRRWRSGESRDPTYQLSASSASRTSQNQRPPGGVNVERRGERSPSEGSGAPSTRQGARLAPELGDSVCLSAMGKGAAARGPTLARRRMGSPRPQDTPDRDGFGRSEHRGDARG